MKHKYCISIRTYFWYVVCIFIMGITAVSCSDISNSLSNSNGDITTEEEDDATNTGESILILGLVEGTDIDKLVDELEVELLDTITIGKNKYIKIQGNNVSQETISSVSEVRFAEPEMERKIFATPNDTFYSFQYAPQLTLLEGVWDANTGTGGYTGAGVKVAVLDTGVDTLHEDFGGAATFEAGWDFSKGAAYTTTTNNDSEKHGTVVAGIVAARKNNKKGIVGVAPDSIILPYRVSDANDELMSSAIAGAISRATNAGADVINLSLGGLGFSHIEQEAVSAAIAAGVTIVAAAGNEAYSYRNFPASYTGVISVASSNGRDEISYYSTKNDYMSVAAPGENIISLLAGRVGVAGTRYTLSSGTSMAAPYVAGVVALLKQKFPAATPAQIKHILETTALDIDDPGFDDAAGHGRVQPDKALATTILPNVTWTELEFTLTKSTGAIEKQIIGVYDSKNNLVSYLYTGSDGKASVYLPNGTYTYSIHYNGASKSGTVVLTSTHKSEAVSF